MSPGATAVTDALEVLVRHGVEFVVLGGTAATIQGAPIVTFDLDIVHRRTVDNVERLLRALSELGAVYRHDARGLAPQASHLLSADPQLLSTRLGPLDVLGAVEGGAAYEDLLSEAIDLPLSFGSVYVLSLERLIRGKELLGTPKDLAMLDVLRAVLDERRRQEGGG